MHGMDNFKKKKLEFVYDVKSTASMYWLAA